MVECNTGGLRPLSARGGCAYVSLTFSHAQKTRHNEAGMATSGGLGGGG